MKINYLKSEVAKDYQDIYFRYKGKRCGIESTVDGPIIIFTMWFGEKWKDFSDIDDLVNESFFDGKTLRDICDKLDITYG
jgi:hypothetical protein